MSTETVSVGTDCLGGGLGFDDGLVVRATLLSGWVLCTADRLENLILVMTTLLPSNRFSGNREDVDGRAAGGAECYRTSSDAAFARVSKM